MSFCIFLYLRGKVYFPIPWIDLVGRAQLAARRPGSPTNAVRRWVSLPGPREEWREQRMALGSVQVKRTCGEGQHAAALD